MSDPIKLLPCPFCGGPPVPWVGRQSLDGGGALYERHIDQEKGTHVDAYVWCHECGARSGKVDELDLIQAGNFHASTIVFCMEDAEKLKRVAAIQWNDRALRNIQLYVAGYEDGHHLYPRPEKAEAK